MAIAPLPESPEYRLLEPLIRGRAAIEERDPLRALMMGVAYPMKGFSSLLMGVDPGVRACGVAAIADGLIFEAESVQCDRVGGLARRLVDSVPAESVRVVLGSGTGWEAAARSLLDEGLEFSIADEFGTSRARALPLEFRDRNVRAAVSLALSAFNVG